MKQEDLSSALIFRWWARENTGRRLTLGAVLALLMMGGWLLLFEVVNPAASRRSHATQRVTLLDSSSPKSRQVVAAVTDRSYLLLSPNATSSPKLLDLGPVFAPGFKDYQLQVKDLPETGTAASPLPRLFVPERPLLPPMKLPADAKPAPQTATKTQHLVAVGLGDLEDRAIRHGIDLPPDLTSFDEINAKFRVAVAPDGHVLTAVSLMDDSTNVGAATSRRLLAAIDDLRFFPIDQPQPQWGIISFRWKEVSP